MRLTGENQRARISEASAELAVGLAEVVNDPPDQTFDDTATVEIEPGGRSIDLRYLGRGHTDNDIVVLVPDAGVVFAGDLLENGAPPSFGDAFPLAWAVTGARLLELVAGAVAPGHGEVADRRFAAQQVAELAVLADLCRESIDGQTGLDEVVRRSPFPAGTTRLARDRVAREIDAGYSTL